MLRKILYFFPFLLTLNLSALITARYSHTMAVLPDGNFMTCGGIDSTGATLDTCEIYNTKTNQNEDLGHVLDVTRSSHTMTVLSDGRILIVGGFNNGTPLQTASIYNPNTGGWTFLNAGTPCLNQMCSPRGGHTATLLSRGPDRGNVLICGGQTSTTYPGSITNSCEIFITSATSAPFFKSGPNMTSSRFGHSANLLPNGKVFISGGINSVGNFLPTQELYNNITNSFTPATSLIQARAFHTAVTLNNGNVLIIGGYNGVNIRDQFSQDPRGPSYGEGDDDVQTRQGQGTQGYIEAVEMFDFNGSRVSISGKDYEVMPYRISKNTAILKPDGKVQLIGGYGNIPVSYINTKPKIQDGSYLYLSSLLINQSSVTALVTAGNVNFELKDIQFSRNVTGRVVEGDIFLSKPPKDTTPSIEIENIKVFLGNSTSTIDGSLLDTGKLNGLFNLDPPQSITPIPYVVLSAVNSKGDDAAVSANGSSIQFNPSPISDSGTSSADLLNTSTLQLNQLSFYIPGIYAQGTEQIVISGTVTLNTGTIEQKTGVTQYTINFTGGQADILNAPVTPVYQNGALKGRVTASNVTLRNLSGTISVSSGSISSGYNPQQPLTNIELSAIFTSNKVYLTIPNEKNTDLNIGKSTAVIRQMIFADEMIFSPKNAKWEFAEVYHPIFDHTAILTPAADIFTQGGRNCENDPTKYCKRLYPPINTQAYAISSPHPYTNNYDNTWTITDTNATAMRVYFSAFNTETAYDFVRIYDLNDVLRYSYTGNLGAFWSGWVPGNTIKVRLQTDSSITSNGFDITQYQRQAPTASTFTATNYSGVWILKRNEEWAKGKTLNQKRAYHTSTILPGNYILTCGGSDGTRTLDSCELYDPNKDEWVFVSSMTTPRAYHTSTLLPNGNVLIAGGTNGSSGSSTVLMSAEIYYPDTNKFVKTSSMTTARMWHTATLLADGNVLVTGGMSNGSYLNSAEIYITTAATWQPITSVMSVQRAQHTATFLKDNRVLIAGGITSGGVTNSVNLFNPITRTFTTTSNMISPRTFHSATLLKDGRVLVVGGTNGYSTLDTSEIFTGSSWQTVEILGGNKNLTERAKHTATLLPNGKVMIVGGEKPSMPRGFAEGFDVDFSTFQIQGLIDKRTGHTTVLTSSGYVVAIGGFDGNKYLDTVNKIYFTYEPDIEGFEYDRRRQPIISTATMYFDRNDNITLLSGATNFHSMSEASGGGSGPRNSSFFAPRVYLNAVDNPSSFLVDLTTRVYSLFGSQNTNWEQALSSLTLRVPINPGELPYGWYNLYVCDNSQFSEGFLVQVTSPRPSGTITNLNGYVASGSTTTIKWTWDGGSLYTNGKADAYAIFSAIDNMFISTTPLTSSVTFYQTGLSPNTKISIKVGGYNIGGYTKEFVQSATYYTYANPPQNLKIEAASFETAVLSWNANNNSPFTPYELSMSLRSDFSSDISTPVPFSNNYTSTTVTLTTLEPNKTYYFRVRAQNGSGIATTFSNIVSTITVGNVSNLQGTPLDVSSIRWEWAESVGADGYYLWDVTNGTYPPYSVYLGSTTPNYYTQTGLSTNTVHLFMVRAFKYITSYGDVLGPPVISTDVYTLSAQPLKTVPQVYTNVSTESFVINWISNGNPPETKYRLIFSSYSNFIDYSSYTVIGTSKAIYGLLPNYPYYAKISSLNGKGIASAETDLGEKRTRARPPSNARVTKITMSGVTIEWDTLNNSPDTVYEVRGTTENFSLSVTTYVPFYQLFTGNRVEISGLWTSTTYYFEVEGKNRDTSAPDYFGYNTGPTQVVNYNVSPPTPNIITLSGPNGTPAGALCVLSNPSRDTTIQGILPDNRYITITIPKDAFNSPTPIAIARTDENLLGWAVGSNPHPISFRIYCDAQPKQPLLFIFYYTADEAYSSPGIDSLRTKLVLARYNEQTGDKLPLETTIDQGNKKITAKVNHFSFFQLIPYEPSANLNNVEIYPNPFFINRGKGGVTIKGMPANSKITIYTLNGEKVYETNATGSGTAYWYGKNKKGQFVGSGIYLCVIKSGSEKKIFKIAVER